jgi:hypothetical protein
MPRLGCGVQLDIDLFCDIQSIVDLNSKISDGAFDLCVAQQKLYCSQIARASIDQGCLGSPIGMSAEPMWIETDVGNPFGHEPPVLSRRYALS